MMQDLPTTLSQDLRNPHSRAMNAMWFLIFFITLIFSGSILLVLFQDWTPAILLITGLLFFLFYLIQILMWISGWLQAIKAKKFLDSMRPIIRWTYSQAEWHQIQVERWLEEKDDWKLQLFGVTFIFGITGVITSAAIYLDDIPTMLVSSGICITLSFMLGLVISAGNHVAAKIENAHGNPAVAIGANEIFHDNQYFKANGRSKFIRSITFDKNLMELKIKTSDRSWWLKTPHNEEWLIKVPEIMANDVERLLIPKVETSKEEDYGIEEIDENTQQE